MEKRFKTILKPLSWTTVPLHLVGRSVAYVCLYVYLSVHHCVCMSVCVFRLGFRCLSYSILSYLCDATASPICLFDYHPLISFIRSSSFFCSPEKQAIAVKVDAHYSLSRPLCLVLNVLLLAAFFRSIHPSIPLYTSPLRLFSFSVLSFNLIASRLSARLRQTLCLLRCLSFSCYTMRSL